MKNNVTSIRSIPTRSDLLQVYKWSDTFHAYCWRETDLKSNRKAGTIAGWLEPGRGRRYVLFAKKYSEKRLRALELTGILPPAGKNKEMTMPTEQQIETHDHTCICDALVSESKGGADLKDLFRQAMGLSDGCKEDMMFVVAEALLKEPENPYRKMNLTHPNRSGNWLNDEEPA